MPTTLFHDDSLSFLPSTISRANSEFQFQQHPPHINFTTGNESSSQGSTSDCSSSSSAHENSRSPLRSPDTTTFEDSAAQKPHLEIVEEPQDLYRFRYKTEMQGTHGAILGVKSKRHPKSYPKVKLCNYSGPDVRIICRLWTADRRSAHVHRLVGKENKKVLDDPHCRMASRENNYTVAFDQLTILYTKKEDQLDFLIEKKVTHSKHGFNTAALSSGQDLASGRKLLAEVKEDLKVMNLNTVTLRFDCLIEGIDGQAKPICDPVYSVVINNMKNPLTNQLRISRIDKCEGSCDGNEEIMIFVEKINKSNIRVKFTEVDDDYPSTWTSYGSFNKETDVHHQYGIAFRTPPWRDRNITNEVDVYFRLERPSDGAVSEPVRYTYLPNRDRVRDMKRKKPRLDPSNANNPAAKAIEVLAPTSNRFLFATVPEMKVVEPSGRSDVLPVLQDAMLTSSLTPDELDGELGEKYPSFGSTLDNIPSADSDLISQFLDSENFEDYANLHDFSELMDETPDSDLQADGVPLLRRKKIMNIDKLLGRSENKQSQIRKRPPKDSPKEFRATNPGPKKVTTAKPEMDCGNRSAVNFQTLVPEPVQGENNEKENTNVLPPTQTSTAEHQSLSDKHQSTTGGPSVDSVTDSLRSINVADPGDLSGRVKFGPPRNMMTDPEFGVQLHKRRRQSVKNLTEENIIQKAERSITVLLGLRRTKRWDDQRFNEFLSKVYSYTVGDSESSLLHVMAALPGLPSPTSTKLINILRVMTKMNFNTSDIVNALNADNETPLHVAVSRGHPEMMRLLVAAGADVNAADARRDTPTHRAARREKDEVAALDPLLRARPDLGRHNSEGMTPLHLAVTLRKSNVVSCLLVKWEQTALAEGGAERGQNSPIGNFANVGDRLRGDTALHMAVQRGFKEVVQLILNFDNIDTNVKNLSGKTPIDLTHLKMDPISVEIRSLLASHGASTNYVSDIQIKTEPESDSEMEDTDEFVSMESKNDEETSPDSAKDWKWMHLFESEEFRRLSTHLDATMLWTTLAQAFQLTEAEIHRCEAESSPTVALIKTAAIKDSNVTPATVRDKLAEIGLSKFSKRIDDLISSWERQ